VEELEEGTPDAVMAQTGTEKKEGSLKAFLCHQTFAQHWDCHMFL
jgi:hypothetical protein